MSVERTLARVKAHVQRYAPEVEVIYQGGMEPSKAPLDSPYTAPIVAALRAGQAEEPLLIPSAGAVCRITSLPKSLASPLLARPMPTPMNATTRPMRTWRSSALSKASRPAPHC
ncbi:MAG: hypothetical protein R2867_35300 [Caldilineaceae bacterium]